MTCDRELRRPQRACAHASVRVRADPSEPGRVRVCADPSEPARVRVRADPGEPVRASFCRCHFLAPSPAGSLKRLVRKTCEVEHVDLGG